MTVLALQLDVVELDKNTKRRSTLLVWSTLRIHRMRIPTLRPHVSSDIPQCTVHEARFHPEILRQQHTRTLAHEKLRLHAPKFIGVNLVWIVEVLGLVMERTQTCNRLTGPNCQLFKLTKVHSDSTTSRRHGTVLAAVHQQWRVLKLFQLTPALLCLLKHTTVSCRKPFVITLRPSTVRHTPRYFQKAFGILAVRCPFIHWDVIILILIPMHLAQHGDVLKGAHDLV